QLVDTSDTHDIASGGLLGLDTLKTLEPHNLQHFAAPLLAFPIQHHNCLVRADTASGDSTYADDANIAAVIQRGNLHLERSIEIHFGWLDLINDHLVQRCHVTGHSAWIKTGNTVER